MLNDELITLLQAQPLHAPVRVVQHVDANATEPVLDDIVYDHGDVEIHITSPSFSEDD